MAAGHQTKPKRIKRKRRGAANGFVESSSRLAIAIRYFAGGSAYDIMLNHGVSCPVVFQSIWMVVDAINKCDKLAIVFPTSHVRPHHPKAFVRDTVLYC